MAHNDDCIFCKIIAGDIPASVVYEDDDLLAFMDLGQTTKGHTLLIPKDHQENIYELRPETAAALFKKAPEIANAIKEAFQPAGMNLLNNNNSVASQSVFHYHLHFIPRYTENDGFSFTFTDNNEQYTSADLADMAKGIADRL